jgi:hypothetical protein
MSSLRDLDWCSQFSIALPSLRDGHTRSANTSLCRAIIIIDDIKVALVEHYRVSE